MKQVLLFLLPVVIAFTAGSPVSFAPGTDPSIIGRGQMPCVASDSKGIHLVYGIGDSLVYQFSTDKGKSFTGIQLITKLPGLNASATRGPQIVTTDNGLCVVASTKAGSVYAFIKGPGGKWLKAVRVTDRDSVDMEGFVSLAGDGHSALFAIWLDLRHTGKNKIYGSRSADGGMTWSKNRMVYTSPDTTVCECCKPSVVMSRNKVYVLFRNWLNGNRDLYLIQSSNQGQTFGKAEKLGMQSWALNGCPMDGGGLAVGSNGLPATVWNRKGTIYSCEPGKEEVALGQGRSCSMTIVDGRKVYAWVENKQVTLLTPKGTKIILGPGQLPVLQGNENHAVLCFWESNKQLRYQVVNL
ncbi:MAG: exo-alpha-sialidase [Chitinophagaceae bacterium]|nr:exo-alpha-sialidase [Chitinophagaceae bacterium]